MGDLDHHFGLPDSSEAHFAIKVPRILRDLDQKKEARHRKTNGIDPLPFLNGTIDVDPENKKSSEEFYNIKCD